LYGHGPLFDQRYNGITAGLGYLEVSLDCLFGGWNVRTVNTYRGKWHNSSADFNFSHNHVKTAIKQRSPKSTSSPHHHTTHKQTYEEKVHISIPVCTKQIKSQIMALATKYFTYALKVRYDLN
jgi:hypothetical protein